MALKHKDPVLPFSSITDEEQLFSYLFEMGKTHTAFYHYTDCLTLYEMLKGKKLFLSRSDTLNDLLEGGQSAEKEKVFIGSFSYGFTENIAMWSMYAIPYNYGVRLRIAKKAMLDFVNCFNESPVLYKAKSGKEETVFCEEKPELLIADVVYSDRFYLSHPSSKTSTKLFKNNIIKDGETPQESPLNWCIKDAMWKGENEVRLILKLKHVLSDPNIQKIAIDFSLALKNLIVTCGPCANADEVRESLIKQGVSNVYNSSYYNKTYFKLCANKDCKRTDFCKKRSQQK
jgi:hypothetical protein